ncbi:MAG: hypothetical protein V7641_998 [Blastocatellia bacterium]
MRVIANKGKFRAKVIAGTHTVLVALDCDESSRQGLMGFAFKREVVGKGGAKWLRSQKVFKSIVPNPKEALDPKDPTKQQRFSTWEHPVQSFLWGDYTAMPDTNYKFTIVPMYGTPVARKRIKEFDLDKWFLKEEHFRRSNEGFVFFIHTKFLLIDPLSDDPLVCSGSANFSSNSLLQNDENMLLVRGDTRVADIYLTEFDRIFRHFYFRDVANEIAARGKNAEGAFLSETSAWTDSYFKPGAFKTLRRGMFFADSSKSWVANAEKPKEKPKPAKASGAKKAGKSASKPTAAK